jgi:hypothetical protein
MTFSWIVNWLSLSWLFWRVLERIDQWLESRLPAPVPSERER